MTYPKLGVGTIRYSDRKQDGNHSIQIQREAITRAAEKRGIRIVEWFIDQGVSAYRRRASQRPGMQKMLDYVLNHPCDAVLFYDESRVTRQVTDFVREIWEEIVTHKPYVKFYSASEGDDQEWDPTNIQTQMRLVLASEDSAVKSRRATDSQRLRLNPEDPKRPGSKPPFGFDTVDGILVQNRDAAVVYFIFHLASWGYGDEKVAEILNQASVPSPGGGEWNASVIDIILNHQAYLGHMTWNVRKSAGNSARKPLYQISLFENVHTPIVPAYLWEMVHGLRRLKKKTGMKFSTRSVLYGIARCKSCNVLLKVKDQSPASAKGQYLKYLCPQCGGRVSASALHTVVFDRIQRDWGSADQATNFAKAAKSLLVKWKKLFGEERKKLLESKERAVFELNSGKLSVDLERSCHIALNYIDGRLREIQDLVERIVALQEDQSFITSLSRFKNGVFEKLSDIERRAFLMAVLDGIKVTFGEPIKITIQYRLSPYVVLANEIGQLTEKDGGTLGKKPKAQ